MSTVLNQVAFRIGERLSRNAAKIYGKSIQHGNLALRMDHKSMTVTRHPDIATLMTCAAGSHPESLSAVIASHLSVCPACIRKVSQLSLIGEALFERLEPVPMLSAALSCDLTVAGVVHADAHSRQHDDRGNTGGCDIPRPLRLRLGQSLDELNWRLIADGVEQVAIELSPGAIGGLRLIRLASGARLRWRGEASEVLLMGLRGTFICDDRAFAPGDFDVVETPVEHSILANDEQGCILLMASEAGLVL